jgi:predicted alpha/beta superfamily hydrolase
MIIRRALRLATIFFALGLLSVSAEAKKTKRVPTQLLQVVVNLPIHTPSSSEVFLTGNHKALCDWETDCLKFQLIDRAASTYSVTVSLPADVRDIEVKITRGRWDNQSADSSGEGLQNLPIQLNGTRTLVVQNIMNWADLGPLKVTGDLRVQRGFYSPQLKNRRDIFVWLPPSYRYRRAQNYPVIYMHDGQNLFDPSIGEVSSDWMIDEVMTNLSRSAGIEAIVVGIANIPSERFDEYNYLNKGEAYARFLIETVKPAIDSNFRTRPEREWTFTGGSSMGALMAASLVWRHPDVFSKAAALSLPAMISDDVIYKIFDGAAKPKLPFLIYIDHGNWGFDEEYKEPVVKFLKYLSDREVESRSIVYREYQYHDHTEADWARRIGIPITAFLEVRQKQQPCRQ